MDSMVRQRVGIIDSNDDLLCAADRGGEWSRVLDLGICGSTFYRNSSDALQHPVDPLPRSDFADLPSLNVLLAGGSGRLLDELGIDWWNLLSVEFYEPMLELLRLRRFLQTCSSRDHFLLSRDGLHARILQALCPGRVTVMPRRFLAAVRQKATGALRLRPSQILQICGDKYDGNYSVRRFLVSRAKPSSIPVVLLPSAYSNASRVALAYAAALPDVQFLLVPTRHSGWATNRRENVTCAPLAAYARKKPKNEELQHLLATWGRVLGEFSSDSDLSLLSRAGCFASVPCSLKKGLAIRDAWLEVFESRPIASVLCADEMNWHTRLPLLIARSRKINAFACHHGALDLRYCFRATAADRFFVKGLMEWDYLVESCGMDPQRIEVGAPPQASTIPLSSSRESIVFFSEPYEALGGRCLGYYQEVLPQLANLARQNRCELVIKLHPFESRRERTRLASRVLGPDVRQVLRIVDGPLEAEFMSRAWFGITVASSAALDCALNKVPTFLCRWLDFSATGYAEQFIRFGVGKALNAPNEIGQIPDMLQDFACPNLRNIWQIAEPDRLRGFFTGGTLNSSACQSLLEERAWA